MSWDYQCLKGLRKILFDVIVIVLTDISCGAVAGVAATVISHPLDTIRTRMSAQGTKMVLIWNRSEANV